MATQTGSYDFKSTKAAKESAEKVATNFVATDSLGMMVYDGSSGQHTPTNPGSTTSNVLIDSDSVDIRQGTDVLATFGTTTRVGKYGAENVTIDNTGVSVNTTQLSDAVKLTSSIWQNPDEQISFVTGMVQLGGSGLAPEVMGYEDDGEARIIVSAGNSSTVGSSILSAQSSDIFATVEANANGYSELYVADQTPTYSRVVAKPEKITLESDGGAGIAELIKDMELKTDSGQSMYIAKDFNEVSKVGFGVGNTTSRHGVYSFTMRDWLLMCDGTDIYIGFNGGSNIYLNGYVWADKDMTLLGNLDVSGTLIAKDDLILNNHDDPVGTVYSSGDVTIDNIASGGSFKRTSCEVTVTAGVWIVNYYAKFPADATGYRGMRLGYGTSSDITRSDIICQASNSSAVTTRLAGSITQSLTSGRTYTLEVMQGSGSSMSGIVGGIVATRLV